MMIVASLITSLVIVFIVLVLTFFVSSEWVLGLSGYLGVNRLQAIKTLFTRVTGMQYPYIIVAEGGVATASKGNVMSRFGGPGWVIIRPFNAAVFEYGGEVKRIVGPGLYSTILYENVGKIVDLRPQEGEIAIIEIPTREGVPLSLTVRYRYQIETKSMETERRRLAKKYESKISKCKDRISKQEEARNELNRIIAEYERLARQKERVSEEDTEKIKDYEKKIKKLQQTIGRNGRETKSCRAKLEEWKKIKNELNLPVLFPEDLEGAAQNYSRDAIGRAVYHAQPEGWQIATEHAVVAAIYDQIGELGLHEIFGDPENPFSATPGMSRMIANNALAVAKRRTAQWGVCVTSIDVISVTVPQSVQERIFALWTAVAENESFIRKTQGEVDRYRVFSGVQTSTADRMLNIFNDAVRHAETTLPPDILPVYISLLSRIAEEIGRDRISAYRYFQTLEAMSRNPNANIIVSAKDDTIVINAGRNTLNDS